MRQSFRLSLVLATVLTGSGVVAQAAPRYGVTGSVAGPDGGWDYASVARFGPIVAPATRPAVAPGSFHFIIVSPSGK